MRYLVFCEYRIRDYIQKNGFLSCYDCNDFPYKKPSKFPVPVGKKLIKCALPYWKEHGTLKWIEHEENRYKYPECDNSLYRGTTKCNICKIKLSVD